MQTPLSKLSKKALRELNTVEAFVEFAGRIQTRDQWHIGGFLGEVKSEWDYETKAETDRVRCEAGGPLPLDHLPEGSS
jgi:hypothetical protein